MKRFISALALSSIFWAVGVQAEPAKGAAAAVAVTPHTAAAAAAGTKQAEAHVRVGSMQADMALRPVIDVRTPAGKPVPVSVTPKPARRAPFFAFCKGGVTDEQDLANRLEKALVNEKTKVGHVRLDLCMATPAQFLAALQQAAPEEGVQRLDQLADFVRNGLVMTTLKEPITFYTSCVKGKSLDGDDVVMKCQRETLAAGTKVLASKKTGTPLVKLNCANVGFTPIQPPPCDLIVFETRDASETRSHHPVYGPGTSSECHGIVDLDATAFKKGKIRFFGTPSEIQEGCIDRTPNCSYEGADRVARPRTRTFDGTVTDLKPGLHAVLVERKFSSSADTGLGVCIEFNDINGRHTSFTPIVSTIHYKMTMDGRRVARIYYTQGEVPTGEKDGLYSYEQ